MFFRLRLNRARELQHKVSVFRVFQTAGGAEHRKARSAKLVKMHIGLYVVSVSGLTV